VSAKTFFAQLRLIVHGKGRVDQLCICGFEVYGRLRCGTPLPSPQSNDKFQNWVKDSKSELVGLEKKDLDTDHSKDSVLTFSYSSDFDEQGVITYLGKKNSSFQYRNPADPGLMVVHDVLVSLGLRAHEWDRLFIAVVGLLSGELKNSIVQLSDLLQSEGLLETKLQPTARSFFSMIQGALKKDVFQVVDGFPLISEFFNVPDEVTVVLNLTAVLLCAQNKSAFDREVLIQAFRSFGNTFNIESTFLTAVVGLANRDLRGLLKLAERFGQVNADHIRKFVIILENLQSLGPKKSEGGSHADAKSSFKKNMTEADLQDLDAAKIFDMFDADGSGSVDFGEFQETLKYMNIDISPHKAMKIFSEVADAEGVCDREAFQQALDILHQQIADKVLTDMGFAVSNLAKIFIGLVILLLGLFAFIFMGIAAFESSNAFGSVVNSVLPCGAAAGTGAQSSDDSSSIDTTAGVAKATSHVQKAITQIKKVT